MKTRLVDRLNAAFERRFPEQRLFIKSDRRTRFLRLRPATQAMAFGGSALVLTWAIVATAALAIDTLGAGNLRDQAERRRETYEARLNDLAAARDARAQEATSARQRFHAALDRVAAMQSRLLASEERRQELESGLEGVRGMLGRTIDERDAAHKRAEILSGRLTGQADGPPPEARVAELTQTVGFLTSALDGTAAERDRIAAERDRAEKRVDLLDRDLHLMRERNTRIFGRLEKALSVSVEPLEKMFANAGLSTDKLIQAARRGYSGQGGPLTPLSVSTKGTAPSQPSRRANGILKRLDTLTLYRHAAAKAPFAGPVHASYRFTSSFGRRNDPMGAGTRMHEGIDLAAPYGTPIYATADGTVIRAGRLGGYGRVVELRHAFGITTRYAHMSKIRVKKGQHVSRGDRIGDMGSSGRSTGSHTHYEVRVDGKPVNPMTYIKAARNVF